MMPILYSYRRCPYAMRARMALRYADIEFEHREIALREKPKSMLLASPKATVPVLCLEGQVLDQSLDIMHWALDKSDPDSWKSVDEGIAATDSHQVNRIYVVAQSTQPERLQNVTSQTNGFIYAASLMGVTGLRTSVASGAHELVARIRAVSEVPIAVGLGVSNAEQAAEVAGYADGVIVGSAFIRAVQEANSLDEGVAAVRLLAESLAAGVRSQKR